MVTDKKLKPRPVYIDRLSPCNNACLIGQNVQKWLSLTKKSKFRDAWEVIMQNNPMPAVLGRVCYHPCEDACNRYGFDSPVNINAVERFLGDMALSENWAVNSNVERTEKKVLVVGGGPAGLSAAYHLRLLGHKVIIYEAGSVAGGMVHYGIPKYRLPRDIIDAEVKRIQNMGVEIIFNHKVEDVIAERDRGDFDAVFIAVGAPLGRKVDIPCKGKDCAIIDAVKFLYDVEFNKPPQVIGQKVIVYGGGNTAIDAARTAVRLGAESVEIIYRRNREKMPAFDFEVAEAGEEGVSLRLLRTIKQIKDKDITLDIMELNEEGWPCPTGKTEHINADTVILAVGLNVDTDFLRKIESIEFGSDNTVVIDDYMMTGYRWIFAGGDVISTNRSVTIAVGQGKKAAYSIDAYLRGEPYIKKPKHELADFEKLHTYFYSKADRKERSQISFPERKETFNEVVNGFEEGEVIYEANRCFSCGNCFECDTCHDVCPVKAITKLGSGKRYRIDDKICIRCGLCAKKCPCGAIKMSE